MNIGTICGHPLGPLVCAACAQERIALMEGLLREAVSVVWDSPDGYARKLATRIETALGEKS